MPDRCGYARLRSLLTNLLAVTRLQTFLRVCEAFIESRRIGARKSNALAACDRQLLIDLFFSAKFPNGTPTVKNRREIKPDLLNDRIDRQ